MNPLANIAAVICMCDRNILAARELPTLRAHFEQVRNVCRVALCRAPAANDSGETFEPRAA